jgi:predicted porin
VQAWLVASWLYAWLAPPTVAPTDTEARQPKPRAHTDAPLPLPSPPHPDAAAPIPGVAAAEFVGEHFDLYGRFAGHIGYGPGLRFANNGTRFGITSNIWATPAVGLYGRLEFGAKLGQGDETFNLGAAGPGEFGVVVEPSTAAIVTRLGYIGIDFGPLGKLAFGKQWGVHYDIAGATDVFDVFGAKASSTFTGGTDGGATGSGRADNTLSYRFSALGFDLGTQVQMLAGGLAIDSAGIALRYRAPFGLRVGGAYNHSYFGEVLRETRVIPGISGMGSRVATLGIGYSGRDIDANFIYARSWNHEVSFDAAGIGRVYDADGIEMAVAWTLRSAAPLVNRLESHDRLRLIGGYNGKFPRASSRDRVAPTDTLHDVILGARVYVVDFAWVYLEGRIGLGHEPSGARSVSSVVVGLRFDFSSQRAIERWLNRRSAA